MLAFGRYLLSAGVATLADFALVQSLLTLGMFREGLLFGVAIAGGALLGMSVNFLLSRRFAFDPDDRKTLAQARSFFVISLSTLVLRVITAYALLALFALPILGFVAMLPVDAPQERLAHIGAAGLVTIYSFFAHKHISFGGGVRSWISKRLAAG
jgi:putative flippase GtrA